MQDHTYGQAYADWQAELRAAAGRCHDTDGGVEGAEDGRRSRARRWLGARRRHAGPAGDGEPSAGG